MFQQSFISKSGENSSWNKDGVFSDINCNVACWRYVCHDVFITQVVGGTVSLLLRTWLPIRDVPCSLL